MTCELTEIQKQLESLQKRMDEMEKSPSKKSYGYDPARLKCPKCSISMENATCYSCPDPECPCGMGPGL